VSGVGFSENAEVVGYRESFFEDDAEDSLILDLYNRESGNP